MKALEAGGYWWLPGREDRKVPGFLSFDIEHGAKLTLIGALMETAETARPIKADDGETVGRVTTSETLRAADTYPRILGEADGKRYTLEDGFSISRRGFGWEESRHQVVRANQVFRGVHFEDGETAGGNCVNMRFDWLTHWIGRNGVLGKRFFNPNPGDPQYTVNVIEFENDSTSIPNNGTLTLLHSLQNRGDITAFTIEQEFAFEVRYEHIRPANDLLDIASDLQDLVSIGTGRTAAFDSLTLIHPDVFHEYPGDRRLPTFIDLMAQWTAARVPSLGPLAVHDLHFTLDDLGGMSGVSRWLAVAKQHRSTLGRVMTTRYAAEMYASDRYLSRLATLEALDRELQGGKNDNTSYNRRLRRCVDLAGPVVTDLVGNIDSWVEILVADRNDIAHHLGRRLHQNTSGHYYLAESAYWLYVFCLLRLAAAPETVFNRIAQHRRYGHLQQCLAKLLT